MATRMTKEEFVRRSEEIHSGRYDYSKVDYVNSHKVVEIICPVHGSWMQKPSNHLNGKGCGKCSNSVLKSNSDILSEFLAVHGSKYEYSKIDYKGVDTPVEIRCTVHDHWFGQTPRVHKRGGGCPLCADEVRSEKKKISLEEAITRSKGVHGDAFDYSTAAITNNPLTIALRCKEHNHLISQPLFTHLQSSGCPKCSGWTHGDLDSLLAKLKLTRGEEYEYSLIDKHYSAKCKVPILCRKHGLFYQELSSHLSGCGCPSCGRQDSKDEIELFEFVSNLFPDAVRRNRSLIGKELDIYIPSKNFAIEYNGLYWHSDNPQNAGDARNRHKEKTVLCKEKGVHLFHLFEDDWLNRKDVVLHTIKHLLGVSEDTVYARKTGIKTHKLPDVTEFYNSYHMQGAPKQGFVVYTLYKGDELVAAMTFSKPSSERGNTTEGRYELLRYASKYSVVGGASKLLKAFIKERNPKVIVSYSDDSMFSGKMYSLLGFAEVDKTRPDYKVIVGKQRKHKSNFRRDNLEKMLGEKFDKNLSERDNCRANGFYRIYNCGLTKWELMLK